MSEKKVPKIRFHGFQGEWMANNIIDIAPLQRGFDLPRGKMQEGKYPVVMSNGVNGYHSEFKAKAPGVTTGRSGTIGNLHYIEQNYWPHNTALWVTDFKGNTPRYVFYMYQKLNLNRFGTGSGVPTLNRNDVHSVQVFTPNADEQTEIGEFFKNLDNLIVQNQKKYDKLVNMKKACLDKMFPKDGTDTPEVRFKGFDGTWEKKKLESTVDFWDEQRKPISAEVRESGIYPYYGASGIIDYVKDYLFAEELVLLSEDGANIIDRNYRVSFLAKGKYWVNNHAHVLKSKQGYCDGFICEALERLNYELYNTGTAQPKLNQEVCRNIVIMVPTFEEQQQIFIFFQTLDNLITLQKTKLEKLKNIKKACLDKMFI